MVLKVVNKHGDMTDRHRDSHQNGNWDTKEYRMGRQQDYNYIPAQETNNY